MNRHPSFHVQKLTRVCMFRNPFWYRQVWTKCIFGVCPCANDTRYLVPVCVCLLKWFLVISLQRLHILPKILSYHNNFLQFLTFHYCYYSKDMRINYLVYKLTIFWGRFRPRLIHCKLALCHRFLRTCLLVRHCMFLMVLIARNLWCNQCKIRKHHSRWPKFQYLRSK
jgi:hypothetical protein